MDQAAKIGISGGTQIVSAMQLASDASINLGKNMEAANQSIAQSSARAQQAIQGIANIAANDAAFKALGEGIGDALSQGMKKGTLQGIAETAKAFDDITPDLEKKADETGEFIGKTIVSALATAVGTFLGNQFSSAFDDAIDDVEKTFESLKTTAIGFFNGENYKSTAIDALIAQNDKVKELQTSLYETANQASATNQALSNLGVNKTDYVSVFQNADKAIRSNEDELKRLGIVYKDQNGNVLQLGDIVKNANDVLNSYTEGWDRNSAAAAIGIGTSQQVAAAASVTTVKLQEAADQLNKYNLGIGTESQAAASRYQEAMKNFNQANELTQQGFKRAWNDAILPLMTDIIEMFTSGMPTAVAIFRGVMASVVTVFYTVKMAAQVAYEGIVAAGKGIADIVGGLAKASGALMSGDFTTAKNSLVAGWDDAKTRVNKAGDDILTDAIKNAKAVKLAWANDDRSAIVGGPGQNRQQGKKFIPKPEDISASSISQVDPSKAIYESQIKALDDLIKREETILAAGNKMRDALYKADEISAKEYYEGNLDAIKDSNAVEQDLYQKEIDISLKRYNSLSKSSSTYLKDKAEVSKQINDIDDKSIASQLKTDEAIKDSSNKLKEANKIIADSFFNAYQAEDKSFKLRINLLEEFKKQNIDKTKETNKLIELENQRHANADIDLDTKTQQMKLSALSTTNDALMGLLQAAGAQQTALGKAAFLAQKAIAVANIIINTNLAASKAVAAGPTVAIGEANAAFIKVTGYADAAITAATAIQGFAGGGDPPLNTPSLVGERGPELFVPKGSGTIIPNHQLGGGGESKIVIENHGAPIGKVTEKKISPTERRLIIHETWSHLDDPNSFGSRSMKRNIKAERSRS
jgi:hypothetical protein